MIRSSMSTHPSAMARAMGEIGDGWILLTLWTTLNGTTRFEEMLQELGVARNILADRLRRLVESNLLERRPIGPNSRRYEYVPTARALTLGEALRQLEAWGERECPLPDNASAT